MTTSNILSYILLDIYEIVSKSIFTQLIYIQNSIVFLIIFIFISIGGFIIGKIFSFLTKFFINLYEIDYIVESKYNNIFFGYKPSYIFSLILKWYIYLNALTYAFQEGLYYGFGVHLDLHIIYVYIFLGLLSSLIFIAGIIIGGLLEYGVLKSNIKENEKEFLSRLVKYITIYIFFTFSIENIGLNAQILITALNYFIIAFSLTIGIIFGLIFILKYKDDILKIIK